MNKLGKAHIRNIVAAAGVVQNMQRLQGGLRVCR